MSLKVPILYYPTTISLVDDDFAFLSSTGQSLAQYFPFHPVETFNYAKDIQTFCNDTAHFNYTIQNCITALEEDVLECYPSDFDINHLYKAVYDANRYKETSIIVADQEMPKVCGLDLVRELKNPYMQKILFTGAVDEKMAVEAFNEGTINGYVKKHQPGVLKNLKSTINRSLYQYFLNMSHPLQSYIHEEDLEKSALTHEAFKKYFHKILDEHNIIEYYLLQLTGTYLLIDEDGQAKCCYTYGQDHFDVLLESGEAESSDEKTLSALEKFEKILCVWNPESPSLPPGDEWYQYLYPAEKIVSGDVTFYSAVAPLQFDLDTESVKPPLRFVSD